MTGARLRLCAIALIICIAPTGFAADLSATDVRNFDRVNDLLLRGGEPGAVGLQQIGALGVKVVIDLRESGAATEVEKQQVERLHMKYINVPLRPFSAPSPAQVEQVLSLLLQPGTGPVFLHCRRGKDRTGTMVACYRIQHDGWDNVRALREAKQHGMSMTERGMQSYILHFSPLTLASLKQLMQ